MSFSPNGSLWSYVNNRTGSETAQVRQPSPHFEKPKPQARERNVPVRFGDYDVDSRSD